MKKTIAILAVGFIVSATACADRKDVITRNTGDLPAPAQGILNKEFPDGKVSYIKIDKELFQSTTYEVQFVHGAEISFNSKGEWIEVDCKREAVPASFIPAPIKSQTDDMFPGESITKIEKDSRDYEVELSNGVELKFDKRFQLREVD